MIEVNPYTCNLQGSISCIILPQCKSRNQRAFFVAKGGVQRLCGKRISNDHHTCLDTKHHRLSNGQCSSNTGRLQLVVASSVPFVETGVIHQKIEFVGILLLMVEILHQLRLRQHCRYTSMKYDGIGPIGAVSTGWPHEVPINNNNMTG